MTESLVNVDYSSQHQYHLLLRLLTTDTHLQCSWLHQVFPNIVRFPTNSLLVRQTVTKTDSLVISDFSSMDTPLSDSYLSFPRSVPQKCTVFKDSGNATSGTPVFRGRDAVAAVRRHTRTFGRMESSSSACTPRFSHRKGASRSSSCSYHPFTTPSSHGESSERTSGRTPGSVSTPAAVIPSVVVGETTLS